MTFKFVPVEEENTGSKFKFTPIEQPEEADFVDSLGVMLGKSAKNAGNMYGDVAAALTRLSHPLRGTSQAQKNEEFDTIFNKTKEFGNWVENYWNPKKKNPSFLGELVGGLINAPVGAMGSAGETGRTFIDQGESLPRAQAALGIDASMNLLGLSPLLGPLGNKGKLVGAATGGAANIAQDAVSRWMQQGIAENPETKKIFENTPRTIALAGITGAGFGLAVPRKGAKIDVDKTNEVAANLKAKQEAETAEAAPTEKIYTPSQLKAMKDWMDSSVAAREQAAEYVRAQQELGQRIPGDNTPIKYKPTGEVVGRGKNKEVLPTELADAPYRADNTIDYSSFEASRVAADVENLIRFHEGEGLNQKVLEILNEPTLAQKVLEILEPNTEVARKVREILEARKSDVAPPEPTVSALERVKHTFQPSKTMRSPGGRQSGAIDFNGILDGVSNAAAKIRNKFKHSPDKSPEGHLIKLTGLNIITPGKSAEEIIARQRAAGFPTGHKFIGNLQSGLDALAETYRDIPLLQDVSQHLRAATSKVAKVEREVRQPIEKALVGSSVESKKRMHMVAQAEMHQKRWFTAAEMIELGLNQKEIRILEAFHQAHDMGWQAKADSSLSNLGEAPRYQSGHWTSEFSTGPFKIVASWKDADGKTHTYRTSENTKHRQNLAMDWIKREYGANPDFQMTSKQLRSNYDRMWSHDRTASSLKELLKMYGEPEHGMKKQAIEAILADMDRAMVEGWSGHDLHMDQKTFARGYAGDRPWRSAEQNSVDFFEAQLNMLTESTRWAAYQEMNGQLKKVFADPDIQSMGKITDVAHQYVLQELGLNPSFWKNWEASMMDLITPMTGGYFSGPQLKEALQSIKSLAYLKTLSVNLPYVAATPMQVANTAVPFWNRLKATGEVSQTNYPRFLKNLGDGLATGFLMQGKTAKNMLFGKDSSQAMWDWAVENNRIPRELIDDYKNIASNPAIDFVTNKLNMTIARPDQIVRAGVFFAFAKELEASGKFDTPEAAWERAASITSQVAMPLTKQDRPLIVDKAGTVGNMAWYFYTPVVSTWNSFSTFARAPFGKNLTPKQRAQHALALVLFGALVGMSGGVQEAPIVGELVTTYDFALEHIASEYPEYYDFFRNMGPGRILGLFPEMQLMNDIVNYGPWSAASRVVLPEGVDMSRKFGMQALNLQKSIPEQFTGPLGTAYDAVVEPLKGAAGSFSSGTTHEFERGLRKALPNLPANQLEMRSNTFLSNTQPNQDMYPGYKNYRNPSRLEENKIAVTRSPREQELKSYGFESLNVRKQKDVDAWQQKLTRRDNKALGTLREKAANALMNDSDLFETKLLAALKFAPDQSKETEQSLMRKITESTMTAKQKELWKTRTLRAVQRYQERLEAENAGKP